jgi:Fic family protein
MEEFIKTSQVLLNSEIDAVVAATAIAFGFVFIHPFVDGNGRIHRYLIHHVLAQKQFSQQGMIFPVSAAILEQIDSYRKVLEHYSHPLLSYIEWEQTSNNNVRVLNNTTDYYRYFDATLQAEFLYKCVKDTLKTIIPDEVSYLRRYEEYKSYLDNKFEMPDKLVNLLIRFLEQSDGILSKRAREKEFKSLSDAEVVDLEKMYTQIFSK